MSSRACHWLFVPSGFPVTVSMCLTATAGVGAYSAVVVCLLGERDTGRDTEKSSGCVVGGVAMMLYLVAVEGGGGVILTSASLGALIVVIQCNIAFIMNIWNQW